MLAWAFIVPWLQAAAGRCWVVDTAPNAGTHGPATIAPVRSIDRITLRMCVLLPRASISSGHRSLILMSSPLSVWAGRLNEGQQGAGRHRPMELGSRASHGGASSSGSSMLAGEQRILCSKHSRDVGLYYERPERAVRTRDGG